MAVILNIESATEVCSVAIGKDGHLLEMKETHEPNSHSSLLAVFVDELLKSKKMEGEKIDAVAVSKGPGSYTGLRIGVSLAKGLCYSLDVPLISVNTLKALAFGARNHYLTGKDSLLCPMIDARRMEVYSAVYDAELNVIKPVTAEIITGTSYNEILEKSIVYFFGNGSEKCQEVIKHPNAKFIGGITNSAIQLVELSCLAFKAGEIEDTAYFEPFYLKDFVATKRKKSF
ncbi:MAG: tRNA (adenosine(37)-N6)-threonylcarbamoyltransferase complex dimerization subunit type 1 TsaB [Bacteroidota bacterium]